MNPAVIQWGPSLLVLLGIVFGVIYNSRSINHLDTRITDSNHNAELRHADLKDFIKSEVSRLENRLARLEQPIIRS
jgi:hypothetical protein